METIKKYKTFTFCACFFGVLCFTNIYGQDATITVKNETGIVPSANITGSQHDIVYRSDIPWDDYNKENAGIFRITPEGEFVIRHLGTAATDLIDIHNRYAVLDVSSSVYNNVVARFGYKDFSTYRESMRIVRDKIGIGNSNPNHLLEIGTDDITKTITQLKVHGGATFNNNANLGGGENTAAMTQISINTDKKIANSALTVAGATFIGSVDELNGFIAADGIVHGKVDAAHYNEFNLWVTKGVVSEDFAITEVANWADDVFKKEYKLPTLQEVDTYIQNNQHLPGIPSEKEVKEKGYSVKDLNLGFLEQIEHLVLYTIQQENKIAAQQQQILKQAAATLQQQQKMEGIANDIAVLKKALLAHKE